MDLVLGVAVTGRVAGLALAAGDGDVIDQYEVDLADHPVETLTDTVIGTDRLLAGDNHRLIGTTLLWSDPAKADELRRALEDSGVHNISVLDDQQAATAMAPALGLSGDATAMAPALGLSGDATAMAPAVGLSGDATAMAPAVGLSGDATAMAPAVGSGLAYSMADDSDFLPMESRTEEDDEADTGPLRPRVLVGMEVVLGIAIADSVARLALAGPGAGGSVAIQHAVIDLAIQPFETLIQAVGDAQHLLAGENRQLVSTQVYSPDPAQADALRQALVAAGLPHVALVSQAEAVTALLGTIFGVGALAGSVALVVTAEVATLLALGASGALETVATAALAGVDAAAAAMVAADMLLEFLRSGPPGVAAAFVMGTLRDLAHVADLLRTRSPLRVELLDRPEFAIARGVAQTFLAAPAIAPVAGHTADAMTMAAMAAVAATTAAPAIAGDATAFMSSNEAVTGLAQEQPQLAYSQAEDAGLFPEDDFGDDEYGDDDYDYGDDEAEAGPVR
ncbi:MAG: hypothetical protein WCB92_29085, partial [Mycobacterium sp.]